MKKFIAAASLSAFCVFGLSGCGGLIKVQRAVEAKGYEVEKVGFVSDGSGKTITVYVEQDLDATQKQEVVDTAKETYPNAKEWKVAKATGDSGGGSKSNSNDEPRKNQ